MKLEPPHLWILAAMVLASGLSPIADAGEDPLPPGFDPITYGAFQECRECPEVQVLVRDLPDVSAMQMDVEIGDRVVSFITAKGVGQRAWCEMVYIDESSWFGGCSVFEFAHDSWAEWIETIFSCEDCKDLERYIFRANDSGCGPTLTGEGRGSAVMLANGLQWVLELTEWDPENLASLVEALEVTGGYGFPHLRRDLTNFFALESVGALSADVLHPVDEVPDSMSTIMDHGQLHGLTELLERQAGGMGSPEPGIGPAEWWAPSDAMNVQHWRGIIERLKEKLLVEVDEMSAEDVSILVGSVKDAEGTNMAFLVPTQGETVVSSTWIMTSENAAGPTTLWSDGRCEYMALRTSKEPEALDRRAPWLGWCASPADVDALRVLRATGNESWAVGEIVSGLGLFNPRRGVEVPVDVVRETPGNPLEQPEMLQEYWDEILFRYLETRERLRRVDELRGLAGGRQDEVAPMP